MDWVFPTMINVDKKSKIKSYGIAAIALHEEVFRSLPNFEWCLYYIMLFHISNRKDVINNVRGNEETIYKIMR